MIAHGSREILVVHPGSLGDVLQAVPALVALRELDDVNCLAFAGQMRLARLLAGTGLVDLSLPFDGLGLEMLFTADAVTPSVQSRLGRFDGVVSWFGSRAYPFPERLRGVVSHALIAPPVSEGKSSLPVWRHLLGTLASWGVRLPARLAPLAIPEAWCAEARHVLWGLGWDDRRSCLFVHPGAGGPGKRWPAQSFARVIREVTSETGCQVLVHRGPADRDAAEQLLGLLKVPVLLLVEPPLHQLAGMLSQVSVYLGADSGVSHLASSVGAPAVIVFPPATRDRWAPWSPTALPLTVPANSSEDSMVASAVMKHLRGSRTSGQGIADGATGCLPDTRLLI